MSVFRLFSLSAAVDKTANEDTFSSGIRKIGEDAGLGERIMAGLETAAIGIAIVFFILIILMAVLYVFKLIFARKSKEAQVADIASAKPAPGVPVAETSDRTSKKLIAAVTAAIAASRGDSNVDFDVLSIKKIS